MPLGFIISLCQVNATLCSKDKQGYGGGGGDDPIPTEILLRDLDQVSCTAPTPGALPSAEGLFTTLLPLRCKTSLLGDKEASRGT